MRRYRCREVLGDIDLYLALPEGTEKKPIYDRIMRHMIRGNVVKNPHIRCQKCWEYYSYMNQKKNK